VDQELVAIKVIVTKKKRAKTKALKMSMPRKRKAIMAPKKTSYRNARVKNKNKTGMSSRNSMVQR